MLRNKNFSTTRHAPGNLVHLADESVDLVLPVAEITTLNVVLELAGAEATGGVAELERPEEVGGLLEVGTDGEDLVDEILHADNAVLAEVLLDDGVVGERDALLVDLAVTALVDELTDGLEIGVTVGHEGLDDLQHLNSGLVETDEDTIVDLEKTEQLEGLALLGVDLVDTLDTDNKGKTSLLRNVEIALLLGNTVESDLLTLGVAVLLDVLLGTLEDDSPLLLVRLTLLLGLGKTSLVLLLLVLALLEDCLGDEDLVLGGNGAVKAGDAGSEMVNRGRVDGDSMKRTAAGRHSRLEARFNKKRI